MHSIETVLLQSQCVIERFVTRLDGKAARVIAIIEQLAIDCANRQSELVGRRQRNLERMRYLIKNLFIT